MSLDAQRLMDLIPYLHMVWSSFVQIGISLVLLWQVVGVATFGGVAVMVLLIPLNSWLARVQGAIQKEMMTCKDNRTKIVNEVLQGIRVIKFFAWESSFNDKIGAIRADELRTLRKSAYLKVVTVFFWTSTPLFVSIITFTAYTLLGNTVRALPLPPSHLFRYGIAVNADQGWLHLSPLPLSAI
jgi:ABC-type multidrug transport system fused ATPase/permease subunit